MAKVFTDSRIEGQEFSLSETKVANTRLPTIAPNQPFYLAVNPESWSVRFDDEGNPVLLPSLKQIQKKAGVCGNEAGNDIQPSVTDARKRGWDVIEHKHTPKGGSYLRKIQTEHNSRVYDAYITVFDRAYAGSDEVTCDRAALTRWVWSLVEKEVIRPPSLPALRRELQKCTRALAVAVNKARSDHRADERAEKLQAAADLLRERIREYQSQEAPLDLSDAEEVSM